MDRKLDEEVVHEMMKYHQQLQFSEGRKLTEQYNSKLLSKLKEAEESRLDSSWRSQLKNYLGFLSSKL
jgi:hypothetical protein